MAVDEKYGEITVENDSEEHPLNGSKERVFVIRERDATAPDVVRMWAQQAMMRGAGQEIVDAGFAVAENMREWQSSHPDDVKVPD